MKRQRTVFASHDMLAHVWAQQSQDSGKSGDGRMYFEGPNLFSYGSHFIIGHIMPDGVALLNADSYSVSTSKHQSIACNAVSHRTSFYVPDLSDLRYELRISDSDTVAGKRTRLERVKKHLVKHWEKSPANSAAYLLRTFGEKKGAEVWTHIVRDCERKAARAKQSAERATRKEALAYGAKLAALSDSKVDETLGRASQGRTMAAVNTKLHHTHRALKAAKRDKQAARVFAILKLGRAIVALEAKREERKRANLYLARAIEGFRDNVRQVLQLQESVASRTFSHLADNAETLSQSSRFSEAARSAFLRHSHWAREASKVRAEQEEVEQEAREAAKLAAWLSGDSSVRAPYTSGATLIRAIHVERDDSGVIMGGTLQTSRGAEVPLTHAVRAFRFLKLCRENSRAWNRNGHSLRVGHFTIDRVEQDGSFVANCHTIAWSEVERLARVLGVFSEAATDEALEAKEAA